MNQELERFEPAEVRGRIAYEHLHRYAICREHVAGQRVLDVACGVGYGTNILARSAAEAVGVDIDSAAVRKARRKYRRDNLKFVTADCHKMPFEPASFDVIVANEMIEHIEDHDRFIDEVKRVLRQGGTFLVSTPNKPIYNRYKTPNAFHVSEMDIPEFRGLLEHHFEHVHFVGLRMALVSAGFDLDRNGGASNLAAARTYRGLLEGKGTPSISNDEISLDDPEYILAICSDNPVEVSASSTIFFSNDDDLWLEHEKIMAWASQLHQEDEVLRADLRRTRSDLDDAKSALEEENSTSNPANKQHMEISSRLLSRLTGAQVDAEPASMIDALFSLNEQLATQRARLETLSQLQTKTNELERELESSRTAQGQLNSELRRAELRLDELQRDHGQTLEDRDRLARDHGQTLEDRDRLARELESRRSESENLGREIEKLELETRAFRSDAEARASRLESELKQAQTELANLKRKQAPNEGLPASEDGDRVARAQRRRQDRLISSHRLIQEQIARSRDAVRGSISAAPSVRLSMLKRLTGSRPIHRTVLFDRDWIARQIPNAEQISVADFLRETRFHRIDPHPLFAAGRYLDCYPDVANAGLSPLEHYLKHGWREGRDPHPFFANDWYLHQNPDVLQTGINPLVHYLEHGWKEGRWPNPVFDPLAYSSRHPDVKASGIEPLTHFVVYGKHENREVPYMGLERDWRTLVTNGNADSLMEHLLSGTLTVAAATPGGEEAGDERWPPRPLNDFWVPQGLRNFLVERNWDDLIPLYTYLYSVMDAYSDEPNDFAKSDACRRIVERAQALSASRSTDEQTTLAASVVIPVYNNVLDTLLCIVSLLETEPKASFEIIVADDCSSDETSRLVPQIGGVVRYFRQPENYGFVGNCNGAAKQARGETIVLLNNDTLPLAGWLDGLLAPFARFERVGLVGSKLISWDGLLQEAGGIFWKDGSAWNFGRGQNPLDPEFNYLKEIDYCSGASIAIPAELWRDLDGFDPNYSPAYCEDSDLAFRIREAGFRTLYSPQSEVIHHEGRSHGRDTGVGIKAYQVTNQQQLFERWRGDLERDHFPNGQNVLRARDRSFEKRHILVIDHYVPQVDKDAGSRTMFQFLEALVDSGWVVTFWPQNLHYDEPYVRLLQQIGVEVIYGVKYRAGFADFLRTRTGLYDAVLLSRPHVAIHFIDDIRTLTEARVLYYGHDIHFERMKAQREVAESTLEQDAVDAMKTMELSVCERCDVILYPSEEEARFMRKLVSKKVQSRAIPAYRFDDHELSEAKGAAERTARLPGKKTQLLFVGGFTHGPNVDGIVWFCREVAPILRSEEFSFDLQIAGSNPTSDVWDLDGEDTHVLGFVSDEKLDSLYRESNIVIAPLRFGAGVKGKVIEAMANGVPVATTRVGAQGLSGAADYLFIGDTAEDFAAAVLAAAEEKIGAAKAKAAVDYVRAHYSRAAMTDVLEQVLPAASSMSQAA